MTPSVVQQTSETLPRVFVDQSFTARSDLRTGVHRVVRCLADQIPLIYDGKANSIVLSREGFLPVNSLKHSCLQQRFDALESNVLASIPTSVIAASEFVCNRIRHPRLKSWLLPQPGHLGMYRYPVRAVREIHRLATSSPVPYSIGKGDILLLPDAYWATRSFWPAVKAAKENGAYICSIVYDLIPLDYPEFVVEGAQQSFREYFVKVAELSDQIVTISETVRQQVERVIRGMAMDTCCPRLHSFELGADSFGQCDSNPKQELKKIFEGEDAAGPYLMIATFEPRKNHRYVLEAFEHVWREMPDRQLCLVGRIGWKCDDLLRAIEQHPLLGKQLFVFHDLSDADVQYCYQHARAILFPSIAEGFGLPLVEAQYRGCYVFASDTEIHREVGGNDCIYSDLSNSCHLAQQIVAWEKQHTQSTPRRAPARKPITWQESASELLVHALTGWLQTESNRDETYCKPNCGTGSAGFASCAMRR